MGFDVKDAVHTQAKGDQLIKESLFPQIEKSWLGDVDNHWHQYRPQEVPADVVIMNELFDLWSCHQ